MTKVIYGNGFEKKMCQILEIWEKPQFLFVLFPVRFALAKPYPFPSNPFPSACLL